MAQYQITLVVNVEADDEDEVNVIAENLEEFLGMHHWTDSKGCVTDITEMDDEADAPLIPDHEYMGLA